MKRANIRRYLVALLPLLLSTAVAAQSLPGFRNPTSFLGGGSGTSFQGWSARVGQRISSGASSGYTVYSTCAATNCVDIVGHNNIISSAYNSGSDQGINCCAHTGLWDAAQDHRFMIITSDNAGLDEYTINGSNGMQRIPPGYSSCIRLGDPRATRQANSNSFTWDASSHNKSSEALFYTFRVTPQNALVFINYAVVARCFDHEPNVAGEFLIRVVREDPVTHQWPNEPINDSMWFRVSAPEIPAGAPPAPWTMGRPCSSANPNGCNCEATTCAYVYKPWAKVAISLNSFLYDRVRIELYTSDCVPNYDPIYAYICGDYQPMTLTPSGCPDPESSVVDTIRAPQGMLSYAWYVASDNIAADDSLLIDSYMSQIPFRQVWPPTGGSDTTSSYTARLEDFVLTGGANAGDTVATQTFMCVMTSALDPEKPFESRIYTNLTNRRPNIEYGYEPHCDTSITFINGSTVLVADGLDDDSTHWVVYADTLGQEPLDTLWGNVVTYHFPRPGKYSAKLFSTTAVTPCTAAKLFVCRAIGNPPAGFSMESNRICETDQLRVHASDSVRAMEGVSLKWAIDDSVLSHTTADAAFIVPLGDHTISLTVTTADSCSATTTLPVTVLGQPTIDLSSVVNAVCLGDSVTLSAAGNISYSWNSAPYDPRLDSVQGQNTFNVSPSVSTTYFLLPSEENPCSVDGAQVYIEVIPYPTATIRTGTAHVDKENGSVTCHDDSPHSASSYWTFSDGYTATGATVTHSFVDLSADSVGISLLSCNRLNCCDSTSIQLPIKVTTVWFPNSFTPDEAANNRFGMLTALTLTHYEIYIYNRQGQLVHTSTDPADLWDGTVDGGGPAPQGTYVYFCRYAYSASAYYTANGTVTLIR